MPSVPWNHCFHFKPLRRLPPTLPLPRVPPLSLGHLVVVAMETTSKMACKSTQQEQREMRPPRGVGAVGNASTRSTPGIKGSRSDRVQGGAPICNLVREGG